MTVCIFVAMVIVALLKFKPDFSLMNELEPISFVALMNNVYCCYIRLTLDEIAAAAELILAQDVAEGKEGSGSESSDEGFGGEVESDIEDERMDGEVEKKSSDVESLGDSGYVSNSVSLPSVMKSRYVSVNPC